MSAGRLDGLDRWERPWADPEPPLGAEALLSHVAAKHLDSWEPPEFGIGAATALRNIRFLHWGAHKLSNHDHSHTGDEAWAFGVIGTPPQSERPA